MIESVIEILAVLLLVALVVVLILALAVGAVLLLTALRVLRKTHKIVGWLRWPRSRKKGESLSDEKVKSGSKWPKNR